MLSVVHTGRGHWQVGVVHLTVVSNLPFLRLSNGGNEEGSVDVYLHHFL